MTESEPSNEVANIKKIALHFPKFCLPYLSTQFLKAAVFA